MKHEDIIKNNINKYLKELFYKGYPVDFERRQAGGYSYKKGIPDMYAVVNGLHIEIEVKDPQGKLSAMQEKWRYRCKLLNIPYICAISVDDVRKVIEPLLEGVERNHLHSK